MERYEALRLIQDNLEKSVRYLDRLKRKLTPEFERKNYRDFDLGIDVVHTAVEESLAYQILVRTRQEGLLAHDVLDVVSRVEPNFNGHIGVTFRGSFYPTDSFLGLTLLRDMKTANKLPNKKR